MEKTKHRFCAYLGLTFGVPTDVLRYDCNTKDDNRDIGDGDGGVQPWQC